MTTARQMAANLRNAQRSTGPRTAVGKSTSSRNALRHGLSRPQEMNAATEADIHRLTNEIVGHCVNNYRLRYATEAATALLDLIRIRKVRTEMLAAMNLAKPRRTSCSVSFPCTATKVALERAAGEPPPSWSGTVSAFFAKRTQFTVLRL